MNKSNNTITSIANYKSTQRSIYINTNQQSSNALNPPTQTTKLNNRYNQSTNQTAQQVSIPNNKQTTNPCKL